MKQMLNEWRSNIWIVLELVIVVLVLQLVFGILFSIFQMKKSALDADTDDIYMADVNFLNEESDGYVPYDSAHSAATDLEMLIAGLRAGQYVEKIGYGTTNAVPYQYNFWGNNISLPGNDGKSFFINQRGVSPEVMEVYGLHGSRGETPRQLADMLRKGYVLLSETEIQMSENGTRAADFAGKDAEIQNNPPEAIHVGAIVPIMRRSDYEPAYSGTLYTPVGADEARCIILRVKPGTGNKFLESLTVADQQSGNIYLTNFASLSDKRDVCQMDATRLIRSITVCALFMLAMIFMGFLGTFWFRTQQRVPEIAIRKVNGATDRDIYARFFAEGLILLAVAVTVAMPLTVWMVKNLDEVMDLPFDSLAIVAASVFAVTLMALLIVAGIYAPARKAAAVSAAEAMKDM